MLTSPCRPLLIPLWAQSQTKSPSHTSPLLLSSLTGSWVSFSSSADCDLTLHQLAQLPKFNCLLQFH